MNSIDRRRFCKVSLGGATTAGVAASIPAVFTGTQLQAQAAANDILGVAVVGVGGRGGTHVNEFMKDPRTTVAAIVDVDPKAAAQKAKNVEKETGTRPAVYGDVRQALDDPAVQIVSCATPNHWHALVGVWAMEAGKDVYIEKPISHNIHEGRALVELAKRYDRVFQTGTQCRSSTAVQEGIAFLQSGEMGECNLARALCYKRRKSIGALGDYPLPADVNFDLWSGPATFTDPRLTRQRFHYDWHWQRHYGNGDSGNQGPHQTDIARWGLGVDRHPNEILTYGGRLGYQAERKDPNYVDAGDTANTEISIFDYGDKTIVFETRGLDVSDTSGPEVDAFFGKRPGNKIGVIFYAEGGYLAQTSYSRTAAFDKNFKLIKEFKCGGTNTPHFKNFIDAVVSRNVSQLSADAMVGHLSAAVSHLGNISYYLGEENIVSIQEIETGLQRIKSRDDNAKTLAATVKHLVANGVDLTKTPLSMGPKLVFDPEKERFVGNPEADALMSREYREGYEVKAVELV